MASSSSAINSTYDVFISFRGKDTRNNFTSHLYHALLSNNIKVFIDREIDRGDEITPALERVIDGAKISIIVFSINYAESDICLEEMARIVECKESKAQIVLPIFYKVDPSEGTYLEAFARHEIDIKGKKRRRGETIKKAMKKVEKWKSALRKALELAGWHIIENSDETEIIGKITKEVLEKLNNSLPKGDERICKAMVGETAKYNFEEVWECLMDDEISSVGVYGMGGVGKTTIATRIYNELLASVDSFSLVCWVTVSKDLSISNMQNRIAKKVKLDFSSEDDEHERAAKLRKRLSIEKFVLILDDVWEAFEIEEVGIPPLVGGNKLILTSRSSRVCERMKCLPVEMKTLSEQEALDLFIEESEHRKTDSLPKDIVASIVKECCGLPLAIVVIARRMRRIVEIWEWRNTLRELQKPSEGENIEMEDKVYKVLKFSYDCLPNDNYRQCFLYCSLFPEDHEFERDHLIMYWIGEGLIDGLESTQEMLDKGNCILDELIHTSLLLDNFDIDWTGIKMHDVIRDMARMNVKVGLQFEDPFGSVQVLTKSTSFPNSVPHCSKLRTLVLQDFRIEVFSDCFFTNMQSLNILHVTGMYRSKSIPNSIINMGNLRVLIIFSIYNIECIPKGIENLRFLEVTCNKHLRDIPKGIERLVNLRVLDLSLNENLNGSFSSEVLEKFSHLQILNLSGTRVEVEPEGLISLEKLEILGVHFFNLQKLNCYVKSGHWRRLLYYRIYYGEQTVANWQREMCLKAIRGGEEWKREHGFFLPDNIEYLKLIKWESQMFYFLKNPNSRILHIESYKSRYLFTVDLAQHFLHNVQELHIHDCNELVEIIAIEEERVNRSCNINYPTIVLPNLKMLNLTSVKELRSIYRGRMVCPSLELIWIECDKLRRLPFCMEKERNKHNQTIKLRRAHGMPVSRKWWDALRWDDPNDKSMYLPECWSAEDAILLSDTESESE